MAKKSLFSKLFSRLPSSQPEAQEEKTPPAEKTKLKFVFFIVDWSMVNVVSDVFIEEKVRFYFVSKAQGTANSDILDLLGFGSTDKALVTCLEQAIGVPVLLKEVRKKLKSYGPGAGIAFTVPLSAINEPALLIFKQSINKNDKIAAIKEKAEGENMSEKFTHDLIMCIVNQGYTDELMNTAREAGARGGTMLHARGSAHHGAVKFFGVSVQAEKEMILILSNRETKVAIMQAISEAYGLNSEAQGIVFSLPVDNMTGLSFE
jgi:nitrogen regulatory protein PII